MKLINLVSKQVYELKSETSIGKTPDNDVVINDTAVSSHHVKIFIKDNDVYIVDLNSTNGTFVNDMMLSPNKPIKINNNDKICFYKNCFVFTTTQNNKTKIFSKNSSFTIGKDKSNDIVINYKLISSKHVRIFEQNNRWYIQDLNSTNGTFLNSFSNRISIVELKPDNVLYLANFKIPTNKIIDFIRTRNGEIKKDNLTLSEEKITIGRNPKSDIYVNNPHVSFNHSVIYKTKGNYEIEDLNSTNGTYVNGKKISKHILKNGDEVSISGVYNFVIDVDKEFTKVKKDFIEGFPLEARNITVKTKKGEVLLDDISFTIYPGELVGLMGLSGAGKTTLLKALNGYDKPFEGSSYVNGNDLYKNFSLLKTIIGYVPQDDIVHPELTVMEALRYYAKERLATDLSNEELDKLILDTLEKLGLKGTENTIIGSPETVKGISGGQRKRLNLAMELLADPKIIFLDEPTSGLSAVDAKMVMELLRKLADEGKTIIITIHQPSLDIYKLMDNVIILSYGKLAYYGPAYSNSIKFFNKDKKDEEILNNPDNALIGLYEGEKKAREFDTNERSKKGVYWQGVYKNSNEYKEYTENRKIEEKSLNLQAKDVSFFKQLNVLISRYMKIKLKDAINTLILLIQAPLIALMISILFPKDTYEKMPVTLLFVLVISAIWFGTINASREIISEKAIFEKERMIGMKIIPYVFSKFFILSILCIIQTIALVGIVEIIIGLNFHDNLYKLLLIIFLTSLSGLSIGLLISTIAKSQAQALALVPIVLLPMIIFGGGMVTVKQMKENSKIAYFISQTTPTRWALEKIVSFYESSNDKKEYCKKLASKDFWKNYDEEFFNKKDKKSCDIYKKYIDNRIKNERDVKEKQKLMLKKENCKKSKENFIKNCEKHREFIKNYYGDATYNSKTIYLVLSLFIIVPLILTALILKNRDKVKL